MVFTKYYRKKEVSNEMLDLYRGFVTPHISANMQRSYAVDSSIRTYYRTGILVDGAFTIKNRPGDDLKC